MWISEALRSSVRVPSTIEPLVERAIYPGPCDPDLWLGLERRPPSQPPRIADVGVNMALFLPRANRIRITVRRTNASGARGKRAFEHGGNQRQCGF